MNSGGGYGSFVTGDSNKCPEEIFTTQESRCLRHCVYPPGLLAVLIAGCGLPSPGEFLRDVRPLAQLKHSDLWVEDRVLGISIFLKPLHDSNAQQWIQTTALASDIFSLATETPRIL